MNNIVKSNKDTNNFLNIKKLFIFICLNVFYDINFTFNYFFIRFDQFRE